MKLASTVCCLLVVATVARGESMTEEKPIDMLPDVARYVTAREAEFDLIATDRKHRLEELSGYIRRCVDSQSPVNLTFICTHNSRRSQLAQVWARVAAEHYGLPKIATYSGGTEATAFNPRAVAALKRVGFDIDGEPDNKNPVYQVRFAKTAEPIQCFSKKFHEEPNPNHSFCAIMTCSQADKACPAVPGATLRLAIPFEDPKVADNTPEEAKRYDERCAQIAREMLYAFSKVKPDKQIAAREE